MSNGGALAIQYIGVGGPRKSRVHLHPYHSDSLHVYFLLAVAYFDIVMLFRSKFEKTIFLLG